MTHREQVRQIREKIDEAIREIASQYGFSVRPHGCTYSADEIRMKIVLQALGEAGEPAEARLYREQASNYGLKPEWLGASYEANGRTYTVVGLDPRKRFRPVLLMGSNRTKYKAAPEIVRRYLTSP